MSKLPTHLPRPSSLLCCRPRIAATSIASSSSSSSSPLAYNASTPVQRTSLTQTRAATFVPRPRRPYTFTQLVQLSDGSTFTVRSTSPAPLVRSVKDSRNHALWQPSDKSLKNVEVDEAGKLAAFRERFGRGFDLAAAPTEDEAAAVKASTAAAPAAAAATGGKDGAAEQDDVFDMGDLISGYAVQQPQPKAKEPLQKAAKKGKK